MGNASLQYSANANNLSLPLSDQASNRKVPLPLDTKPVLKNMNANEERFLRLSSSSVRTAKDVYAHRAEQVKQAQYPLPDQKQAQAAYPHQPNQLRRVGSARQ